VRVLIADRLLACPARVALARVVGVALVVFVGSAALAVGADRYGWEEQPTVWVVDLPESATSVLRVVMQAGNRLAVAGLALIFLIADRPRRAAVALVSGWTAWLVTALAKGVIGRPRPSADVLGFSPEEFVSGRGFPSAHTAVVVALAVVVVTAADVPRALKVLAVAVAIITGVARVHLAVHWPLDVIGGVAVGVLVAGIVVLALDPPPVPDAWPGVGRWPPVPAGSTTLVGSTGPGADLRVATFNIRNGWSLDGRQAWWFRRGATADTITALDADLIGLQEVYASQRRWLESTVPGRGWIGLGRTDGRGRGEQCPITWRPERLHLESWEVRWFGDRPDQAGSRLPGARVPRIATIARFRDRRSDAPFGVVNAHLDSQHRDLRTRSAEQLLGWLTDEGLPWIVLGDLNDVPGSPPLTTLAEGGLRTVGPDDGRGTAHEFTGRSDGRRLDHVLVAGGWSVGPADVPNDRGEGPLPSDHWPLVVDLHVVTASA
jgi:endonuclease/exonuclease/phosphatase family metal-dependent hydrolase/membrane-associated phospholipid phosphatase